MRPPLVALAALALAASCTEPQSRRVRTPSVPTGQQAVRLALSDSAPVPGARLVVRVVVADSSATLGSFTGALAYDAAALRFAGHARTEDGAMRVVNPQPGVLRIAAASPVGFPRGEVIALRFDVIRVGGARSFAIATSEAHRIVLDTVPAEAARMLAPSRR
jgi:hypothetical protein